MFFDKTLDLCSTVINFFKNTLCFGFSYAVIDLVAIKAYQQGMESPATIPNLTVQPETVTTTIQLANDRDQDIVVIIPCLCNTLESLDDLARTLDSLLMHGPLLSIILCVDGPSIYQSDITILCHRFSITLTLLILSKHRGAAFARNQCLDQAQAFHPRVTKIAMIDSGIIITPAWAMALNEVDVRDQVVCGITSAVHSDTDSWLTRSFNYYYEQSGVLNPRGSGQKLYKILYAPTCNLVICKKVFSVRFLHDVFTDAGFEDVEYSMRVQMIHGIPIALRRDMAVCHHFRTCSFQDFWTRFKRYGRNHAKFQLLFPHYHRLFSKSSPVIANLSVKQKMMVGK